VSGGFTVFSGFMLLRFLVTSGQALGSRSGVVLAIVMTAIGLGFSIYGLFAHSDWQFRMRGETIGLTAISMGILNYVKYRATLRNKPNQSSEPTLASGTPRAPQEPRLP
jgi:high-affinity Fe2+/Pb2+ permease